MNNDIYEEAPFEELIKTYRYKIYARKSSEESGRQIRSINDQIDDCRKLALKLKLKVIGEVREEKSAKTANNRPLFKALLKEVKDGKIDGIIAWHPDRLARNMVEAGKIIDMLDKGQMKDLRFHSHQFDNSSNGKMMLGMLFVFAKHYSDDLSDKVKRGVRKRVKEGLSGGVPKHGYIQKQGIYTPDDYNDNFGLIKRAWGMRANGDMLSKIAKYLNDNHYSKYYTEDGNYRIMKVTVSTLGKMFADSFYMGVLTQANQKTDLRELGLGFIPIIDEATFGAVSLLSEHSNRAKTKDNRERRPLQDLIYCAICGREDTAMLPNIPNIKKHRKNGTRPTIYLSCKNKICSRSNPANPRMRDVIKAIEPAIESVISMLTEDAYEAYLKETKELSSGERQRLRSEIERFKSIISHLDGKNDEIRASLGKLTDDRAIKKANDDISDNLNEINIVTNKINENNNKLRVQTVKHKPLTPEEFNSIIEKTLPAFRNGRIFQKERIIREIFSKLYFGKEKVESYTLREPFRSLVLVSNNSTVSLGGGGEIRTPASDLSELTI